MQISIDAKTTKMEKLKNNLHVMFGTDIYSYTTLVAIIHEDHIEELGYWSKTTRTHINYAGQFYNLEVKYYKN